MNKFDELFEKYDCNLDEAVVKQSIESILAKAYDANNNKEVYKKCLNMIDLTSLNSTDTNAEILAMVDKIGRASCRERV